MSSQHLCPIGKALASSLDASFVAALLLSAEHGQVLHNNLHALMLLGDDFQGDSNEGGDSESESNNSKSSSSFERWIELPKPLTWEGVVERLNRSDGDDGEQQQRHSVLGVSGGNGKLANVVGALRKDNATSVTINFSLIDSDSSNYVVAYLKTDVASLSVDEVTTLQLDKDLVDGSFDPMFVIDEDGTILMMNEASAKTFGYSYAELLHHNISKICGDGHGCPASKHRRYMQNYYDTGTRKVIGKVRKTRARRKDGSEFPVELGVNEIKPSDGTHQRLFCGYVKDMTAHEKHEKELLHRETLMQGMIDASYDPMFQIDEKGVICMINNAAVQLFGWTREEFVGSNIAMICGGGHAQQHDGYMHRYMQTGEKKVIGRKRKVPAVRKDGTEFDVELGISEVRCRDTGERVFCGYIRDLTQERLNRRLLQRKEAQMQGQFFGSGGGDEK